MKLLATSIVVAALIVAGCAMSTRNMPPASALGGDPVEFVALERGRMLIVTECSECHRIYWPQEYSSLMWPGILDDMRKRASLNGSQTRDIVAYYVAAAQHAESNVDRSQ